MPTLRCIFFPLSVTFWFRVFFILAACCSTAYSAAEALPEMIAKKVSSKVWYVEGLSALGAPANQNFISNAAFVVTPAGVVVIDALGSPVLAERLLAEIGKITRQPVTHVICVPRGTKSLHSIPAPPFEASNSSRQRKVSRA